MAIWDLILGPVFKLIDKVVPDVNERERQKSEIIKMQMAGELEYLKADVSLALGQMEINKEEAKDPSLFKSGWRPAVGWLCVAGFGYTAVARPLLPWILTAIGHPMPPLPAMDTSELMTILMGMLGLGGMRTAERIKGKA